MRKSSPLAAIRSAEKLAVMVELSLSVASGSSEINQEGYRDGP
jgi:hypothetical protein